MLIVFIYLLNKFNLIHLFNDNVKKFNITEKFLNVHNLKTPKDKAIKLLIPEELQIYRLGYEQKNTYMDNLLQIFRKSIYPIEYSQTGGDMKTIELLNNNQLDLGFIDENSALEYQKNKKINFSTICVSHHQNFIFIILDSLQLQTFEDILNKK